ncbi:MAG: hypothetical protein QXJ75_03735 [Candidatus Bathyarchaeia archaeon]
MGWTGHITTILCILFTVVPGMIDPAWMPVANLLMYPVWMVYPLVDSDYQAERVSLFKQMAKYEEYMKMAEKA